MMREKELGLWFESGVLFSRHLSIRCKRLGDVFVCDGLCRCGRGCRRTDEVV